MRSRLAGSTALVLAGTLTIAACGGDDDDAAGTDTTQAAAAAAAATTAAAPTSVVEITEAPGTDAPAGTSAGSAAGADFNDADVVFAQGMIAHHEQAIEMADIALDPTIGASAEVQDLATRIKAAQDPEIEAMTGWLTAWGQPVQMDTSGGHDMSSMEGVMTAEEMDALGAATGAEFDTMWLEMMIRHHEGAISMAETVKASGSNADVLALAEQIITTQQAEIEEMQALLDA
jgi:uncharacterized protein (DUF305 family)